MSSSDSTQQPNRLIHETSPYLLQHAYNPVDWYPWGPEALGRARDLNKPILLSIGYSACHWCHVMERESFENDAIAAVMNEHFISVKVDREERPDLDEIYMQATLALNHGQGGWPMTVFLTPDQRPFFAGTYFPPADKWGRPGFRTLLEKIAEVWRNDPQGVREQAEELTSRLKTSMRAAAPLSVGEDELEAVVGRFAEEFDARYGGFGQAPKFPPATGLSLLLRRHARTGDPQILQMVRKTLDGLAAGGIYDHIGGGFARYSTDERWLVPHFEKMLYDNALLTRTYLEAYQVTDDLTYRRVASETLDYILREMTAPEGGFFSATDADSEGIEGKYFVWTPDEIRALLPEEEARFFCAYYDITPGGNWEHNNIPNTPRPLEIVAKELGLSTDALQASLDRSRPLVYAARRRRIPPGLDDKILTGWNGLMISAMAEGARVLGDNRYLEAAEAATDFLLQTMRRPDGGLYRTYRKGRAHLAACLEDYACLAEGLIDLYEAGAHEGFLAEATRLAERILADFPDAERGGFYTTARDHEQLIVRSREGPDGATPSANAVAASVLARLSFHLGRDDFREAATRAVRVYGRQIGRYPRAFCKSLIVLDLLLHGPVELALVGIPGEPGYESLRREVHRRFVPAKIIAHFDPGAPEPAHPLLKGKSLVDRKAALYICRNFACQAPITEPSQVRLALAEGSSPPAAVSVSTPSTLSGSRLAGSATSAGTKAYVERICAEKRNPQLAMTGYVPFGNTGLTTSKLGFGGYRIGLEDPEHREAIVRSLLNGCNLIDTSTNYTDGDSERLIGLVLADLIKKGQLRREEVIVMSKIGYVQGQNLARAQARESTGRPYPEMVKYGDALWHCLHPDFIADQLDLSLDRLGLETLDVCLLHNVEYFLSDAAHRGQTDLPVLRTQFYGRLRNAFEFLERQVAAGRVRFYGVSSNTCTAAPDNPEAASLSHMLDAARDAGGIGHHFRVLQCPMNLFESGALFLPNTGPQHRQTVLSLAQRAQLAVLINRPLNAIPGQGGMVRLADLPLEAVSASFESQQAIVAKLEEEFRSEIAPLIKVPAASLQPADFFRWGDEAMRLRVQVRGLEHWEQIEHQMIAPHVQQVLQAVSTHAQGELGDRWHAWRERYVPELLTLLKVLRRHATESSLHRTRAITRAIDPHLPEPLRRESLSRKALCVVASTPGVTCVLNGMRTPAYVDDSLGILAWNTIPAVEPIFESVQSLRRHPSS